GCSVATEASDGDRGLDLRSSNCRSASSASTDNWALPTSIDEHTEMSDIQAGISLGLPGSLTICRTSWP
ncbi:MAG: hypothetical protein WBR56_00415, partial [Sedimenticolaceae bacterium]